MKSSVLEVLRFGAALQNYSSFSRIQKAFQELRKNGEIPDTLLTLQYQPVYTLGKRGKQEHLLKSIEELQSEGFAVEWNHRGGEVTYHGPGQIVVYPILALRERRVGARLFVEKLEEVMIKTCAFHNIQAHGQIPGKTGVWINDKKIGAIGVRISQGISSHGFAFNVKTNLSHYHNIIPCGFSNKDVTNLDQEVQGGIQSLQSVDLDLIKAFVEVFDYNTIIHKEQPLEVVSSLQFPSKTKISKSSNFNSSDSSYDYNSSQRNAQFCSIYHLHLQSIDLEIQQ